MDEGRELSPEENSKLYNIYFAIQGTFYSLLAINIVGALVGILFLLNQLNCNSIIIKANEMSTIPDFYTPNSVVLIEEAKQGICPNEYKKIKLSNFWGVSNLGIVFDARQFSNRCSFTNCNDSSNIPEYTKQCRFDQRYQRDCCDYNIDATLASECKDSNFICSCPKSNHLTSEGIYPIKGRTFKRIQFINPMELFLTKDGITPLCMRKFDTTISFSNKCDVGISCFGACIQGIDKCPNYSTFDISNRLLYDIDIIPNAFPCTVFKSVLPIETYENELNYIYTSGNKVPKQGCQLQQPTDLDVTILKTVQKTSLLRKDILDTISLNDALTADDQNSKLKPLIDSDSFVVYGKSNIKLNNFEQCNENFKIGKEQKSIHQVLDIAFDQGRHARDLSATDIWFVIDAILLVFKLFLIAYLYYLKNKAHKFNEYIWFIRLVFFFTLGKFLFSGIKFFIFRNDNTKDVVSALKLASTYNCISNNDFNNFITKLAEGLDYFTSNYNYLHNQSFILDGTSFALVIFALIPILGVKVLLGIKSYN